ncbi:MAG: hypothetical protein H6815_14055 [Phycisphaeraceae bacterium]|nr:hypothetical protein [Phycisphaerales bacterium]MCB9861563.1 hypothetical protein [Phycisphaeraceae bacterium]
MDDSQLSQSELTELLSQDLMGCLDPSDRIRLHQAWSSLSPEQTANVRTEVDALAASIESMLPEVEPLSPDFADRIVKAVLSAGELAGTSGELVLDDQHDIVGQIGVPTLVESPLVQHAIAGQVDASEEHLRLIPSRRVSRFWRAMALASISAAAILGVAILDVRSQVSQIEQLLARDSFINDLSSMLGGSLQTLLFEEGTEHIRLTSETYRNSDAVLLVHPETGKGQLIAEIGDITDGRKLAVVIIDGNKGFTQLETFTAQVGLVSVQLENLKFEQGQRLAIYDLASGKEILTTRSLDFLLA